MVRPGGEGVLGPKSVIAGYKPVNSKVGGGGPRLVNGRVKIRLSKKFKGRIVAKVNINLIFKRRNLNKRPKTQYIANS